MMHDPQPLTETRAARFSWRRVARLAQKELREIFRDRRTIITLIAMPLLLYPLMSVAFQQFYFASRITPELGHIYRVSSAGALESHIFQRRFDQGLQAWQRKQDHPAGPAQEAKKARISSELNWYPPATVPGQGRAEVLETLQKSLSDGLIDLVIEIPEVDPDKDKKLVPQVDKAFQCRIYYAPSSALSRAALSYVETIFAAANQRDLKERLGAAGAFPRINFINLQPTALKASAGEGVISPALVPLILILMTITGAVYPAIDLTAGERERGTLEILVAAPVPRFELLSAKYISVVTVAVLNAIVNLTCMAITVAWSGLASVLFHEGGLSLALLGQVLALLLLFAAFFSAVLLCLTSFARSFKEAQAYLIPLMLASLAPGIMAMIPELKLQGVLMVLPLVNIVLLARDLFVGEMQPIVAGVVVFTTLLYALAALGLAARVFGAESVLYSEQSSWADLLRRSDEPQPAATIPAVLWCLALMVPLQFSLHALLRMLAPADPVILILLGVAVSALLFLFLPGVFMYLGRVEIGRGLGLAMPPPAALVAGLLLGVSLWPLQLYLLSLTTQPNRLESIGEVLKQMQTARDSLGWGILIVVIVPAILEEFFFRGLLFNALKSHASAWLTIVVSGLLFGLSHVVLGGALGLERLVPSTVLGLLLSVVCWRSGSLWPSLIQHVCHNALLLIVGLYDPGSTREIPLTWLVGSAAGILVSGFLLWQWGGTRQQSL